MTRCTRRDRHSCYLGSHLPASREPEPTWRNQLAATALLLLAIVVFLGGPQWVIQVLGL